jgi:hypothetical protein
VMWVHGADSTVPDGRVMIMASRGDLQLNVDYES